jgi:hypothetical protein
VAEKRTPVKAGPTVRWTKESVEYARSVHITLVAFSVSLILLVASAKTYPPDALKQITEIVGLEQHWSPDWIWHHRLWRNDEAVDRSDFNRERLTEIMPGVVADSAVEIAHIVIVTVYESHNQRLKRDDQFLVSLPEDRWLVQSLNGFLVQKDDPALLSDPVSLYSFPENLDQFKLWWEGLQTGRVVLHPEMLSGTCRMADSYDRTVAKFTVAGLDGYPGKRHVLGQLTAKTTIAAGGPLGDQTSYTAYDPARNLTLTIPLAESTSFKVDQNLFASLFHWPHGRYDASFAGLVRASGGLESLQLEDLQKNLATAAAKGPETFEVLGVKLPAEQITTTGILLVLGLQIYLLLHFRQRSTVVPVEDSVWDLPWIAFDQSGLGEFAFFSSLVLGTAAIAALTANALPRLLEGNSKWTWKVCQATLFLAAIAASAYVSIVSWRSRPKLSPGAHAS